MERDELRMMQDDLRPTEEAPQVSSAVLTLLLAEHNDVFQESSKLWKVHFRRHRHAPSAADTHAPTEVDGICGDGALGACEEDEEGSEHTRDGQLLQAQHQT
eukprot:4445294-Amphidinium_carterae.1